MACFAALALSAAPAVADATYWKVVGYWPNRPLDYGCVGFVYTNAAYAGYFTRTKIAERDGGLLIGPRHPAGASGAPTARAAIDAERALRWHGCW